MERRPLALILDCDGVLTDGKKYIGADGQRAFIAFNAKDDQAITRLIDKGVRVAIVTQSDFEAISRYWNKKGVRVLVCEEKTPKVFEELGFDPKTTVVVGDDVTDLEMMLCANVAFTPLDGHIALKKQFMTLPRKGGKGIVQSLETFLLWSH